MTNITYPTTNAPMPLCLLMKNANGTPRSFNFLNDGNNPTQNRYIFVSGGVPDLFVENYTMAAAPQYASRVNTHTYYSHSLKCSGVSHWSTCQYPCHVAAAPVDIHKHFTMFSGFRWMWHQLWNHNMNEQIYAFEMMFRCSGTNQDIRVGLMNALSVDDDDHGSNFGHERYVTSVLLHSAGGVRSISESTFLAPLNCSIVTRSSMVADGIRIKSTDNEYFAFRVVIDPITNKFSAYLRSYMSTPVLPTGLDWDGTNSQIGITEVLFADEPVCTTPVELAPAFSSNAHGNGTDEPIAVCGFRWLPAQA